MGSLSFKEVRNFSRPKTKRNWSDNQRRRFFGDLNKPFRYLLAYHKAADYIDDYSEELLEIYRNEQEKIIDSPQENFFFRENCKKMLIKDLRNMAEDYIRKGYGTRAKNYDRVYAFLKRYDDWTIEECGNFCGVSRERFRQFEAKTLRQFRHPTRANKYKDLLPDMGI